MKNIISAILVCISLLFSINKTYCQQPPPGSSCLNAAPFCTGIVYNFPMSTNTTGESGPNYGCLHTYPNPVWYYLKIDNPGNITIRMDGTDTITNQGLDVDFICWGPFNTIAGICTDSLYGRCAWHQCPNNTSNPTFYPSQSAPRIIDCSYDPADFENCRITNALHGEYYMLCITNYSNRPGRLSFQKVSGNATTDCSIVFNRALFDVPYACEDAPVQFNDSSKIGGTITGRLWDFGDGQTDTAKNPVHTYDIAGKYLVRLTVTAGTDIYTVAHYVTVYKLKTSISASSLNICRGDSVNVSASITTMPQSYTLNTFVNENDYPIHDWGVDSTWTGGGPGPGFYYVSDTIMVSGINPGWNINNITLNIQHPYDNDIVAYVKAPIGTPVQLIKKCGGSGDNFTKTSFAPPPVATTNIRNGTPPFAGTWIPTGGEGIWGTLNGFVNPNGPWILSVADITDGNVGKVKDWSIEIYNPEKTDISFRWSAPINDSTRLSHFVHPTDTTTYTITAINEFGCQSSSSITINVVPDPVLIEMPDTTICRGDTAIITAQGALQYTWMPGNINGAVLKVAPDDTITYYVTGYNEYGCHSTKELTINVADGPELQVVHDTTIYVNTSVTLKASGANEYLWLPDNITGPTLTVTPLLDTYYYLHGTDLRGCTTIDTILVRIDYSTNIFIPNTFSPNNDLHNDILYVRGYGLKSIEFTIYDRLGEKVFYSVSQDIGWDGKFNGKQLNPGIFVYSLKAETFDNKTIEKKGNITLIK